MNDKYTPTPELEKLISESIGLACGGANRKVVHQANIRILKAAKKLMTDKADKLRVDKTIKNLRSQF